MMSSTICIPRERYEHLIKCEKIVDSEFTEKFSEDFIRSVKESQAEYEKGDYTKIKDKKHRDKIFDEL
jgi:hypothetical protein